VVCARTERDTGLKKRNESSKSFFKLLLQRKIRIKSAHRKARQQKKAACRTDREPSTAEESECVEMIRPSQASSVRAFYNKVRRRMARISIPRGNAQGLILR